MTNSTEDKAKGTVHDVKGGIKETMGRVTDNPDLEAEGTDEKLGGKIQNKIGDIKKVFEK